MSATPLTLTVLLFIHPGEHAAFARYERIATNYLARYGARIDRRMVLAPSGDPARPDEIHLVTFPDSEAFDRYRRDPELQQWADLRAQAIRQTIIWPGEIAPLFADHD